MPRAISIRSDDKSSDSIRSLWSVCGVLELKPSMTVMSYPPHITFAVYDDIPLQNLFDGLELAAGQLERASIIFTSLEYFETPENIVIWASPNLPDQIFAAHSSIHARVGVKLCHENYQPGKWIPHCSVATAVPIDKKEEALAIVNQPFEPLDVVFDTVDCVQFMPVKVLNEFSLR